MEDFEVVRKLRDRKTSYTWNTLIVFKGYSHAREGNGDRSKERDTPIVVKVVRLEAAPRALAKSRLKLGARCGGSCIGLPGSET